MALGNTRSGEVDGTNAPTQDGHLLAIETPLGKDVVLLTALDGTETVSRGFVYTIEMLTLASDAEVRTLLGKPVTMWLRNDVESLRRALHGHVRHLTRLTVDLRGYRRWRAEVAPWLWFLTRSVDCRIYQDLAVPEILHSVFDEHGLTHHDFRLNAQYPKLVFCVQYRESAFAFVSRLMEHVGIFYWFEHHQDRHVMVLSDANNKAPFTQPRQVELSLRPDLGEIQEVEHDYTFHTGNWALNDFDFEVPTKNLRTHEPTRLDIGPMKQFETYDYPGSYTARDHGAGLTRLRMEEEEARHHRILGSGSCVGFDAGKRFTLAVDQAMGEEKPETYLLTELRHSAREPGYFSTSAEPAIYSNRFFAIPAETPFRPERLMPKPIVQGSQTATVVGPAGENIHTDQYGRVRVLFHWDRRGKRDEHASCWIRVSQQAAGSHWGGLAIPHVGQEVVVSFLEGDPDRPIVTGHVHNGNNMPPLNLPSDKNKTILRDHGDNKLIMHGEAGAQWMSLVSPRAINFVAMREPAKPLSSGVPIDPGFPHVSPPDIGAILSGFDPYEDPSAYNELQRVYNELTKKRPPTGSAHPPDVSSQDDPDPTLGDFVASKIDINTLSESEINSLSLRNTNTWVGADMNTWVRGDAHNHICHKQTDYYLSHDEDTPLMHNEVTGMHNELTGIHVENTGIHIEGHTGIHVQTEIGWRFHLGEMGDVHQDQQNLQFFNDHIKVVNQNIETINTKLSTFVTKTELTAAVHSIMANTFMVSADESISLICLKDIELFAAGGAVTIASGGPFIVTTPTAILG
jgi:type VI secretion system secreted protein VgrG